MTIFPSDGEDFRGRKLDAPGDEPGYSGYEPKPYDHVMIDIETLSLHPHKALILSIGMIEFDPEPLEGMRIGNRSVLYPDFVEQLLLCRRVDVGTQEFWAKQSAQAQEAWREPFKPTAVAVDQWMGCLETTNLVRSFCLGKKGVWANGTQFDLSNIVGLAADVAARDRTVPSDLWHYQAPRDMRTFVREVEKTRLVTQAMTDEVPGVPHEAIYDCIIQALQVWERWRDH